MSARTKKFLFVAAAIFLVLVIGFWKYGGADLSTQSPPLIASTTAKLKSEPTPPAASLPSIAESNRENVAGSKQKLTRTTPSNFKPLTPEEVQAVRSEIKISLAAIYGAEKSFYSEFLRYSSDLKQGLGYMPETKQRWSKVGFLSPYSPDKLVGAEDPRYLDTDAYTSDPQIPKENQFTYKQTGQNLSLGEYSRYCQRGCMATDRHFEVIAVAQLVEGNEPDVWIINDDKVIRHVNDGLVKKENP